jgi:ComF family protein
MLSNFAPPKFDSATTRLLRRLRMGWRTGAEVAGGALPQACMLCAAPSLSALLCAACSADMPRTEVACPRCGLPSVLNNRPSKGDDGSATPLTCGACLARPPPFAMTIAAWRYGFPADRLLQAFKYGAALALADVFARAIVDVVVARHAPLPDGIAAVPLALARQRQRGFNQAQEIARVVSSLTGVPLMRGLRRRRDSPPQAGLARAARSANVRRAFICEASLDGATIALVDDVMTTGATIAAASTALLHAGAARVDAWVVARTPPPSSART